MKRFLIITALLAGFLGPKAVSASGLWKEIQATSTPKEIQLIHPDKYKVYRLDESILKGQLWNLSSNPALGEVISLPMPDGRTKDFRVWETSMMPAELANKYPGIRTFTAEAVNDRTVTAKLDFTLYGFHAMIFDGENVAFIDPYDNFHDGLYISYYKKDLTRPEGTRVQCQLHSNNDIHIADEQVQLTPSGLPKLANKTINGYQLRTYRLALACSYQYASTVTGSASPTKAQVLSKMTTSMNRINGVYEREFSLTMVFAANEDNVIFIASAGDPYFAINSNAGACLTVNQGQCDALIGTTNYDIGHVFTTGSGGLASLGCVCTFTKAHGTTGGAVLTGDAFNIDYVAHEMGHQFGSDHTFNDGLNGACAGGNAVNYMSYEPGSGSTIMAYAGLCSPDDVQSHSDAYFHVASIEKIYQYLSSVSGSCSINTPTGNLMVKYDPFSPTSYTIPYLTPFELTAPVAVDSMSDDSVVLYAWEQYDIGGADFTKSFANTSAAGPIFRSQLPSKSNIRVFPKISSVLAGNLNTQFEKAPTVARPMKFRCLYRNIRYNKGCITIPTEIITVNAVTTGTGAGFKVTSHGASTILNGGSTETVTWDVVNTNSAPVNAANVDIYMSVNGGISWNYYVGTYPNSGSASINVPNPPANSTTCRFKVKGSGNVFFNVNSTNFTVNYNSSVPVSPDGVQPIVASGNDIKVFPVPATGLLHITATQVTNVAAFNILGQRVWSGEVSDRADIDISAWAKGIYYIQFTEKGTGNHIVKQVVVQ